MTGPASVREVIVAQAALPGVSVFSDLSIEMVAAAKVPLAGHDRRYAILTVGVRRDRVVCGHEQQNRVKARFFGSPNCTFG
ncbi:MAG TPA: hypothetical protein VOA41_21615 [Candidatus Dormibacteraeota bacterium]|nr:hypothetical protein [Candidatus Dormibacteraeota bacterium]